MAVPKRMIGIILLIIVAGASWIIAESMQPRDPSSGKIQAAAMVYKEAVTGSSDRVIEISASKYEKVSDPSIYAGDLDGKSNVLIWESEQGEVEYKVHISEPGPYLIYFEYLGLNESTDEIERGLMINGEAAESFVFEQQYAYDEVPFRKDAQGNEQRPKHTALQTWRTIPVKDKTGMTSSPLQFMFSEGENHITLTGVRGAVALSKIILKAPEAVPNYNEYKSSVPSAKAPSGYLSITQGEHPAAVSSPGIRLFNIAEAGVDPVSYGKRIYNAIGGTSWRLPQQWVEWEFDIQEEGLYHIGLKYKQSDNNALNSYRTIEIDGEVPFLELQNTAFPYSASWENKVLGDQDPYEFYFTEGKHWIRLEVTVEPYHEIYNNLVNTAEAIRLLDREIKKITGVTSSSQVDMYKRYDLEKYIPDLSAQLTAFADVIRDQVTGLSELTGSSESEFDLLRFEERRLRGYADNLENIPKSYDSLTLVQTNLLNFAASIAIQPLLIDSIMIKSLDASFPQAEAGLWESVTYFTGSFAASFEKDSLHGEEEDAIEVWVQRNRDVVDYMQQYANEYFTPLTGYKVNVNYIPGPDVLILANAAGKQPDVVTGVSMDTPFNFALRNAVVNLKELPGYGELRSQFPEGTMIPFQIHDGEYALPEEAMMNLLFYREDILTEYNVPLPNTWEDIKKITPSLQQHGMNFWMPQSDWLTFFYQNDISVYKEDGTDVAFDTPEGFSTFKYMTDLFVKYNLPVVVTSFYQHFRQGDIPVGVSSMSDYLLFRLAAPEISSLWKIAPIPGTLDEDGSIVRWHSGDVRGIMMLKTTEERQQKAWEFVKWWMSTETQAQFVNDLENNYGMEFRWYSANPEVVKRTPWSPAEREVILEQLRWFKGTPFIAGGSYMTGRELSNAWTGTVIYKYNYREELERALQSIRREISRYQREYGLSKEAP